MRPALLAILLASFTSCDFPYVPPLDRSLEELQPAPGPGEAPSTLAPPAPPRVAEARLVANAISSVVVDVAGTYVTLQIGPSTRLAVGDEPVGPRALLPGSDVRVTWRPGGENVALEIRAEPGTLGWEGTRPYGTPPRE